MTDRLPDLVKRDFTAERPGVKFVGDITYIHTWRIPAVVATGNLYITASNPAIFLADRGEDRDPWRGAGRPRGTETLLQRLRESKSPRYAVTGSLAAAEWAPCAPTRMAYVYVDSIEEVSENWGLRASESAPNIVLLEPKKPNYVVFDRLLDSERGFVIASPSQVAVDLLNGPGRNPSEAQELLSWMSTNESKWRKG